VDVVGGQEFAVFQHVFFPFEELALGDA
jgi:hypothetical protein